MKNIARFFLALFVLPAFAQPVRIRVITRAGASHREREMRKPDGMGQSEGLL